MLWGHQWLPRHGLPMVTVFRSHSGGKTCSAHYSWLLGWCCVQHYAEGVSSSESHNGAACARFGTSKPPFSIWHWRRLSLGLFPLQEWQTDQFPSCCAEPSQKCDREMSRNSRWKSSSPREVITLPCSTDLYCSVQVSPCCWCSPSCRFSWRRVPIKNVFYETLVWKDFVLINFKELQLKWFTQLFHSLIWISLDSEHIHPYTFRAGVSSDYWCA